MLTVGDKCKNLAIPPLPPEKKVPYLSVDLCEKCTVFTVCAVRFVEFLLLGILNRTVYSNANFILIAELLCLILV